MEAMEKIPNISIYNQKMARTVVDKIFFLAHIDADVFVDFGCADGEVLRAISNFVPDSICIGYDISSEMIKEATLKSPTDENFVFTSNKNYVVEMVHNLQQRGHKVCLILSSVIHEVYSYSTPKEIRDFWKFVQDTGFDYVSIRDMTYQPGLSYPEVNWKNYENVENSKYSKELADFEQEWGLIKNNPKNALNFFLKYRYKENWDRELYEDYLPLNSRELQDQFPYSKWKEVFKHLYTLPYIEKIVKEDFNISIIANTHIQLIYEKR